MEKKIPLVFTIALLIVLFGGLVRFTNPSEWMTFDYDQEVAWSAASKVWSEHKLTLIGQELSVGGVFIGPGLIYSLVPWSALFGGDPFGMLPWVILVYLLTAFLFGWVAYRWFGKTAALFTLVFYAVSPSLAFYDRLVAPSTLLLAHSLFFLYHLDSALKGRRRSYLYLGIALGLGMHITPVWGFMLIIVGILLLFKWLDLNKRTLVLLLLPWFIGALALILFEVRHGWLITQNVLRVLNEPSKDLVIIGKFKFLFGVLVGELGRMVSSKTVGLSGWIILMFVIWAIVFVKKDAMKRSVLMTLWLLAPVVVFVFYSRHIPEYYLASSFPIIPLSLGLLSARAWQCGKMARIVSLVVLAIMTMGSWQEIKSQSNPFSLYYKKQIVYEIIQHAKGRPYAIDFVSKPGLNTGFTYLFTHSSHPPLRERVVPSYTVIMPISDYGSGGTVHASFGSIGVKYPEEYNGS